MPGVKRGWGRLWAVCTRREGAAAGPDLICAVGGRGDRRRPIRLDYERPWADGAIGGGRPIRPLLLPPV